MIENGRIPISIHRIGVLGLLAIGISSCRDSGVVAPGVVNSPPVARDDEAVTKSNDPIDIDVLANDTDADGDKLAIVSVGAPANGTAAVIGSVVHYQPSAGFVGIDEFSYTVSDSWGATASANITVRVVEEGTDSPPVALDPGPVSTNEDTSVTVRLTGSDAEDAEAALNVTVTSLPSHGVLDLTSGPAPLAVTYTPAPNFFGSDSLAFVVTDSALAVSEARQVEVSVVSVDDNPVAVDDVLVAPDGVATTVDVLANDTDSDAGSLAVVAVGAAAHGSTALSDGVVTYTSAVGYYGPDAFTYTCSDGQGGSASASVHVTVTKGYAPGATPLGAVVLDEDSVSGGIVLTGTDKEDAEAMLIVSVLVGPSHGELSASTGQAPLTVVYAPDANFAGSDAFEFSVVDTDGNSSHAATVGITVNPVNDPPLATAVEAVTTSEDTASGAITLTGTDIENAATDLTVSVTAGPSHGLLSATSGRAPLLVAYTPAANYHGTDAFAFVVTDKGGLTSGAATVSLTVTAVNDQPVATAVSAIVTDEDVTSATITLTGTDEEDATADLTVSVTAGPSHGLLSATSGSAPLLVTYAPAANYNGDDSFSFLVTDKDGLASDARVVSITVNPVNDPPVATAVEAVTTSEDTASGAISLTGTDIEDATADLTVSEIGRAHV
jgi:hypothetical protein